MKNIKLTNDQASTLTMYLLMTTSYRSEEFKTCRELSLEKKPDGSSKFPKMESNANWWESAIMQIEEILSAIDAAPYERDEPDRNQPPYERTQAAVEATGNEWANESFHAKHG